MIFFFTQLQPVSTQTRTSKRKSNLSQLQIAPCLYYKNTTRFLDFVNKLLPWHKLHWSKLDCPLGYSYTFHVSCGVIISCSKRKHLFCIPGFSISFILLSWLCIPHTWTRTQLLYYWDFCLLLFLHHIFIVRKVSRGQKSYEVFCKTLFPFFIFHALSTLLNSYAHSCTWTHSHHGHRGYPGRSTPNHSTNGVMVDSPSKKQTCPWDLLHSHAKWFMINLLFYDQNKSV